MYLVTIKNRSLRRTLVNNLKFHKDGWVRVVPTDYLVKEGDEGLALILLRLKRRYKTEMIAYRVGEELTSSDFEKDYDKLTEVLKS